MKTTLKVAAILAVLAPAAFAQDTAEPPVPTAQELQVFRDAITSVGCSITSNETAAIVESSTGYADTMLEAIVGQLRVYDEIIDANEEGGITLVSGECAV